KLVHLFPHSKISSPRKRKYNQLFSNGEKDEQVFEHESNFVVESHQKLVHLFPHSKITDYTSSFVVKKFSNGEKDEQVFDAIQPQSWIRVRGSVQ
ncbi:hypothetical protein DRJ85_14990, partial [Enterococcus faecalis]